VGQESTGPPRGTTETNRRNDSTTETSLGVAEEVDTCGSAPKPALPASKRFATS